MQAYQAMTEAYQAKQNKQQASETQDKPALLTNNVKQWQKPKPKYTVITSREGVECANDNVGNPELTQSLHFGAMFTALMDITSNISNFKQYFQH